MYSANEPLRWQVRRSCRRLHCPRAAAKIFPLLFLCAEDRILCGFGDSELQNGLCRNFDFGAGRRVASESSLSLLLHQLPETRKRELTLLRFSVGKVHETGDEILCLLLAQPGLL